MTPDFGSPKMWILGSSMHVAIPAIAAESDCPVFTLLEVGGFRSRAFECAIDCALKPLGCGVIERARTRGLEISRVTKT